MNSLPPPPRDLAAPTVQTRISTGFERSTTDLGTCVWGSVLSIDTMFCNGEPSPLRIAKIDTSCGCAVVEEGNGLRNRLVQPGESVPIRTTWDIGIAPGRKYASVTLHCDTGESFRTDATVLIEGTWELSTDTLEFDNIAIDGTTNEAPSKSFVFVSNTDALVGSPVADAGWLDCTLNRRDAQTTEVLVRVNVDKLPAGKQESLISVSTTNAIAPRGTVYVTARGYQTLRCIPSELFLRTNESRRVTLYGAHADVAQPVEISVSDPALSVRHCDATAYEVQNTAPTPLAEAVTIRFKDATGQCGRLLVTTF